MTLNKALAYLLTSIVLAGCSRKDQEPATGKNERLVIVATIFPIADWVSVIGGDSVNAVTLLPPAASPHTYEPTPSDMRKAAKARLFFQAGLHLDDWATKMSEGKAGGARVISLGDQLHEKRLLPEVEEVDEHVHDVAHSHGPANPHWFLDPATVCGAVEMIAVELSAVDPSHSEQYAHRAAGYVSELRRLDDELSASLANCSRGFATVHNSFAYLVARYNLKIAAVIEEYPGKVPSDQYIRSVVDRLRAANATTVFVEPQLNARPAEIVAKEAGAKTDLLDPLGDPSFPDRDSYLKLMRYNGGKLKGALCQ